jgi:hypothetical protein
VITYRRGSPADSRLLFGIFEAAIMDLGRLDRYGFFSPAFLA